jgi:hypothetical protein
VEASGRNWEVRYAGVMVTDYGAVWNRSTPGRGSGGDARRYAQLALGVEGAGGGGEEAREVAIRIRTAVVRISSVSVSVFAVRFHGPWSRSTGSRCGLRCGFRIPDSGLDVRVERDRAPGSSTEPAFSAPGVSARLQLDAPLLHRRPMIPAVRAPLNIGAWLAAGTRKASPSQRSTVRALGPRCPMMRFTLSRTGWVSVGRRTRH